MPDVDDLRTKHLRTLKAVYARPVSGTIRWSDVEALFQALGADIEERAGSRVAIVWRGDVYVFHRPHPEPEADKGAVVSVRKWLKEHGVQL